MIKSGEVVTRSQNKALRMMVEDNAYKCIDEPIAFNEAYYRQPMPLATE